MLKELTFAKYLNYKDFILKDFINKNQPKSNLINEEQLFMQGYDIINNKLNNFILPKSKNFREQLMHPDGKINIRMLSLLHLILIEQDYVKKIYINEKVTNFFSYFKTFFKNIIGSEYCGENFKSGEIINGVLHQDLEQLSFADNEFDIVVSSEVLEHVSDYNKCLKEIHRVLKEGGECYMTFPFVANSEKHTIRAYKNEKGNIIHLMQPEYHGDPLSSSGSFCFRYFGWQILEEAKNLGFKEVFVYHIYDPKFCYIAHNLMVFKFQK